MKKLILIGRSESGKSTLIQALRGETLHYHKTQYVGYGDFIIDTPGEYAEDKHLGGALAVYSGLSFRQPNRTACFRRVSSEWPHGRSSAL